MNKKEIIDYLASKGITQLRKGETVKNAMDFVKGIIPRVGYEFKDSTGKRLSKNRVIELANREAFSKSVNFPEYIDYDFDNLNLEELEDCRNDEEQIGWAEPCNYCGIPLRVDYHWDILNCKACGCVAIWDNCM